ncbi:hypothetical protein ANSO36C_35170 [Nostoc cf. commune SO-36]|uniref:NACHT conflict system C-terminal helical domain-containing protein n=1 Tax=Nostoc cf. commune SO-36 TaxID=449208 RepID=A0ABN6Q4D0_NOSCO|nr:hypothetical protein ANSO36C_35170 [Nostoc cf. commune SO-36]
MPNASTEPEELQLDSEGVLQAIELQHGLLAERVRGIFSFSYLTFQEYLTARKIVGSYNLQALKQPLELLVTHITEPRWREIFLLTVAMLRNADFLVLLMKQEIDALVAEDPYLQKFLKHRNIKHDWHFSPKQEKVLQQYYDANQLLLDCLNSNCEVTGIVRQEIEASLLLPIKKLSEREW